MSRRAASIEPEDGECTPSPVAAEHSSEAHRHAQLGQVPTQPMEVEFQTDTLPPPPAVPIAKPPAGVSTQKVRLP